MNVVRSIADVTFPPSGLLPAVVRDLRDRSVLMLAWMNAEALERTLANGEAWFWSRSRAELWHKGARSGSILRVVSVATDCDRDAILLDAVPAGPACHTGSPSCFGDSGGGWLGELMDLLRERKAARPAGSYSASLFDGGRPRILKKIGEEAAEVIVASAAEGSERVVSEVADLLFHLSVLLVEEGLEWGAVEGELRQRGAR